MGTEKKLGDAAKRRLDASVHAARALARRARCLSAYEQLLACAWQRSTLLARRASLDGVDTNRALVALALHRRDWVRPLEAWWAAHESAWSQLGSLAEHLLARFAMPRCMTTAWLAGDLGARAPEHGWYVRLGRGESVRALGLSMRITRAMAHAFARAPAHLSPIAALRWTQILTLGGSDALARAILETRLGRSLDDDDFWETVIHFFLNHSELDLAHVGPIVDFVQHQRFEHREGIMPDGRLGRMPPPDPHFSMKGRTPHALLHLVRAWHRDLARARGPSVEWKGAPFRELTWVERVPVRLDRDARAEASAQPRVESRVWSIQELRTSAALVEEGRAMRHCVATYVPSCVRRQTSIWSMQVETSQGTRRALTIEVDLSTRTIRQARRKANAMPGEAEKALLARWAAREGLTMIESLRA